MILSSGCSEFCYLSIGITLAYFDRGEQTAGWELVTVMMRRRNQWKPYLVIQKIDKLLPPHMVFNNSDKLCNELDSAGC